MLVVELIEYRRYAYCNYAFKCACLACIHVMYMFGIRASPSAQPCRFFIKRGAACLENTCNFYTSYIVEKDKILCTRWGRGSM